MHALRRFYVSTLLARGVTIKELADYLGHSDPGFTLRTYTQLLPSSHEQARRAVDTSSSPVGRRRWHPQPLVFAADGPPADRPSGPAVRNRNGPRLQPGYVRK
ncbi:MAG: hypothetical protein DLM60_17070 [Pseudonocardiales bacterium]|nr:MAG: hypothetical protein DLM60_17070 [Pseudonocardiales bacterium]